MLYYFCSKFINRLPGIDLSLTVFLHLFSNVFPTASIFKTEGLFLNL